MSMRMVDYIVDEHNIDIGPGCLKKVKVAFLIPCSFDFRLLF